jgi:hypothetical protein
MEQWWLVVQSMADLVACGFEYDELEEDYIRVTLENQGYSHLNIDRAMDWLEMASISGNISEVFSMLQATAETGFTTRVASPLETAGISEKLWLQFEEMRNRGIISSDLAERLLEGIRTMDTRDWEDEEVNTFLEEIVAATMPHASDRMIKRILRNLAVPEFYS